MTPQLSIFYVLVILLISYFRTNEVLSQSDFPTDPSWNVPETFLCPSANDCSEYTWVDQDLTLYVVSMTANRVAVVPPDGSEARTYDVADQLQPYPQRLQPGVVPLPDRILLYRLNPFGLGIDILQLDRTTGDVNQLALDGITPFVHCAPVPHISQRALFPIDEQRVIICSEGPAHHFNVHVVNIVSNTVEQTLRLGSDALDRGRTRGWASLEVGLDGNLYFMPFYDDKAKWGIDIPDDTWNYQIKYEVASQTYSLSPLPLDRLDMEDFLLGSILVGSDESKFILFTGVNVNSGITQLYKLDRQGNILWQISNPSPPYLRSMMLIDNHRLVISYFSNLVILSEPLSIAMTDQTATDTDNSGSESATLDGSASTDADGSIVSYIWTLDGSEIASGATPIVELPIGAHAITLIVTDDDGLKAYDEVTITILPAPTATPIPPTSTFTPTP